MHARTKALIYSFAPALAFVFFVLACVLWVSRLGLAVDEATHGVWAWKTLCDIKSLLGWPEMPLEDGAGPYAPEFFSIALGGRVFPLMTCFFTGTFLIYWLVPWVLFFGDSVAALRIAYLPFGIAFVLSVFYVTKRFFGRAVGAAAFVLLCFNSGLIRALHVGGEREELVVSALCWGGMALFLSADSGRRQPFKIAAAGLLWGFALWAKISFAAYAFGLLLALAFMPATAGRGAKARLGSGRFMLFGAGFVLGSLPFLLYNILSGFGALRYSLGCLLRPDFSPTGYGDNQMLVEHLLLRASHIRMLLSGELAQCAIDAGRVSLGPAAALVSACVVFAYLFFSGPGRRFARAPIAALGIVYAVLFVFSAVTPSQFEAEHVLAFVPFFEIMAALALGIAFSFPGRGARLAAAGLTLFVFASPLVQHGALVLRFLAKLRAGEATGMYLPGRAQARRAILREKLFPIGFVGSDTMGVNCSYGLLRGARADDVRPDEECFYLLAETRPAPSGARLFRKITADRSAYCRRIHRFESKAGDGYALEIYRVTPLSRGNCGWITLFADEELSWHWVPVVLPGGQTPVDYISRLMGYSAAEPEPGRVVFVPFDE